MLTIHHCFEFLIQEKIILFFLYGQLLQSWAPLLGLAKFVYYAILFMISFQYKTFNNWTPCHVPLACNIPLQVLELVLKPSFIFELTEFSNQFLFLLEVR